MNILIWIICILIYSLVQTTLKVSGVTLGFLGTIFLFLFLCYAPATFLCSKYYSSKFKKKYPNGILSTLDSLVTSYKRAFLIEHDYYIETDLEVFEESRRVISSFNEKAIQKQLIKKKMKPSEFVLNCIQNIAMNFAMDGDIREVIKQNGKTYTAIQIYKHINDKKLAFNYINKNQYDDNLQLIESIPHRLL